MSTLVMKLPDLGEGVVEAEIVTWLVAVGDDVTADTPIAEVMTDKATVELNAPAAGTVAELLVDEGAIVAVGTEIISITGEVSPPPAPAAAADTITAPTGSTTDHAGAVPAPAAVVPATTLAPTESTLMPARSQTVAPMRRPRAAPTVRRLARARGIDLATVTGTGPERRVLAADVEGAADAAGRHRHLEAPSAPPDTVEPLRGLRRSIAGRMSTAWAEVPHITYVDDVDAEQLERCRQSLNERADDAEPRATLLTFIARAVMVACRDSPRMNATFDTSQGTLHVYGHIHLGIATQTDNGLVVPVVHDADQLTFTDLTHAIRRQADAARQGTLGRDDLSGSTITISSLGRLGGIVTTPIVNHPEVAVVGVNKLRVQPVWNGTSFEPRRVMHISASFDHRVIDGWDAAVFVQRIKSLLEEPATLTLGWGR